MSEEPLHQRLDREAEEHGWWRMPRPEVRDTLIVHYWPFAQMLGRRAAKRNRMIDEEDACSEATKAMIHAIDSYDPAHANGATFTTFASLRVNGGAIEAERQNDWVPHKARAADKEAAERGDKTLPRMVHWKDGTPSESRAESIREFVESTTDLVVLLGRLNPVARRYLEWLLDSDWDLDGLAKQEGTSPQQISLCIKWAIDKAMQVPVAA